MSNYHKADTKTQWFQGKFPGSTLNLNPRTMVLGVHTTEGTSWDGYQGGAVAPNYTARPNFAAKRLDFRAHFPDEKSSRALVNSSGGVETNTLNVVQIELVGTCDPAHRAHWGNLKAGVDYVYWPDAPDWALRDFADFVLDMHKRHGLQLKAPTFKAYPGSYGTHNGVRLSFAEWRNFAGICGHQHVPENVHGDPGDFPIERVLAMVKGAEVPAARPKPPAPKPAPAPPKPTRVSDARALIEQALALLDDAVSKQHRVGAVKTGRDTIRRGLNQLPRR